jgi:pimeloyl-ACP methyl ester carboxylesterase
MAQPGNTRLGGVTKTSRRWSRPLSLALFSFALFAANARPENPPLVIKCRHESSDSLTGRLFLVFSTKDITAVHSQNWFSPEPFFAQDVSDWPAGKVISFTPTAAFPKTMAELPTGKYFVQAIFDDQAASRGPFNSPGNRYSKAAPVEIDPAMPLEIQTVLDQVINPREFKETERVKLFELRSPTMAAFIAGAPDKRLGISDTLRAGVVLPKTFADDPKRTYPVVYEIPGFGGDHHHAFRVAGQEFAGAEMIRVVLDPVTRGGHHVFADSATNGPVGTAFVKDFIPALEKQFRGSGQRFVTGHSSGGWSSLWLQVTYPDVFDGVWSTAPDSVDFRDFQLVDIYEPGNNLLFDANKNLRPIARKDGKTALTTKQFSDMEVVFGRGGQLYSFEAVFSPLDARGLPRKLWDRETGAIDPKTAEAWKAYDIRLVLEKNWPTLGPKLAGKIHVVMGAEDTFFLDGATRLLKASLEKLGSDAAIEIVPGKHHGNLVDAALRKRMSEEMSARVKAP